MKDDFRTKLLAKHMNRQEFLQLLGGSLLVLFGLGNLIALMGHVKKTALNDNNEQTEATSHGFGSRKFGA
jgi:hypothetical protein